MTNYMKRERDARDAFQIEMNAYGLAVEHSTSCTIADDFSEKYVTFQTEGQPVKGNKALIEKLEAAGYTVAKSMWRDKKTGRGYYVFRAKKTVTLKHLDNDADEYVPERPQLIQPEIGKTYDNHGGGQYRCLWSSESGATFINTKSGWRFQARGIRQYKDGTIEWDYSTGGVFDKEAINPCNCTNCDRQGCVHRGAFRRLPKDEGGLGLCYNLKEVRA